MDSFAYVKHLAGLPEVRRQVIQHLVRGAFYEDFDNRRDDDADQDFPRVLSQIVEAIADSPDPETAFIVLRDVGVDVSFQTYDGLDSVYGQYDDLLARMIHGTLVKEGRAPPIEEARFVRGTHNSGVAVTLPWLEGSGRCLFVPCGEDRKPIYAHHGDEISSTLPWHRITHIGDSYPGSGNDIEARLSRSHRDMLVANLRLGATVAHVTAMRREQDPSNPVWDAEIAEVPPANGVIRLAAPRIATMTADLAELRRSIALGHGAKAAEAIARLRSEIEKLEGLTKALA